MNLTHRENDGEEEKGHGENETVAVYVSDGSGVNHRRSQEPRKS